MTRYKMLITMACLSVALAGCGGRQTDSTAETTVTESTAGDTANGAVTGTGAGTTGTGADTTGTGADTTGTGAGTTGTGADTTAPSIIFTDGLGTQVSVAPTSRAAVISGSFAQAWMLAGGQLDAVTEDVYSERDVVIPATVTDLGMLKSPNVEALIGSSATFVILSANIEEHIALRVTLEKSGMTTAYFDVETFEDYLSMMKIFTDITGRSDLYKEHGTDIESQIEEQIARAGNSHPTVLFLRAFSTGVRAKGSAGNMTGKMLKDLGCINIADDDKGLLDDLSMESIIARDPDYIFVTTMGSSDEAAMKSVEDMLLSNPAWKDLTAVKNNRYHVLPKALFHNKPNNRWGESYQILADILYGENKSESN